MAVKPNGSKAIQFAVAVTSQNSIGLTAHIRADSDPCYMVKTGCHPVSLSKYAYRFVIGCSLSKPGFFTSSLVLGQIR